MDAARKISGMSPYLHPKGGRASEAVEFYKRALAAEEVHRLPADDGKRIMHVQLLINGSSMMMSDEFPEMGMNVRPMGGFTIHLQVDDVDFWWQRAVDAGATAQSAPQDMFWGDRYGSFRDPFDIDWSIGGPVKG